MFISADGDISATVLGMLLLQLSARLSLKGDFDARRSTGLAAALLHGGFERRDGAVVESITQRVGNQLARVYAFG